MHEQRVRIVCRGRADLRRRALPPPGACLRGARGRWRVHGRRCARRHRRGSGQRGGRRRSRERPALVQPGRSGRGRGRLRDRLHRARLVHRRSLERARKPGHHRLPAERFVRGRALFAQSRRLSALGRERRGDVLRAGRPPEDLQPRSRRGPGRRRGRVRCLLLDLLPRPAGHAADPRVGGRELRARAGHELRRPPGVDAAEHQPRGRVLRLRLRRRVLSHLPVDGPGAAADPERELRHAGAHRGGDWRPSNAVERHPARHERPGGRGPGRRGPGLLPEDHRLGAGHPGVRLPASELADAPGPCRPGPKLRLRLLPELHRLRSRRRERGDGHYPLWARRTSMRASIRRRTCRSSRGSRSSSTASTGSRRCRASILWPSTRPRGSSPSARCT